MAKMLFRKTLGNLVPADDAAVAFLRKCKLGEMVMVEARRPRNLMHHRKLWALLNLVVENTERYSDADTLLDALKIATGHCKIYPSTDGKTSYVKPLSISFESMDQDSFSQFYERCLDLIAAKIIPGISSAALREEVESFIVPGPAA